MEVYFIRHGQTNGNLAKRHQHPNSPLNSFGQKQVEALVGRISALQPTYIITSTQLRAVETARILTSACSVIPETNTDFRELEHPMGIVGTRYIGWTTLAYAWRWFFGKEVAGGETYRQFLARIKKAKATIEALPVDSKVVIVSHSVFTNIFIEHLCLDERMNVWQAIRSFVRILTLRNAGIIHLHFQPGKNICGWSILEH